MEPNKMSDLEKMMIEVIEEAKNEIDVDLSIEDMGKNLGIYIGIKYPDQVEEDYLVSGDKTLYEACRSMLILLASECILLRRRELDGKRSKQG